MQFTTLILKSIIKSNTCQYNGQVNLLFKFSHHTRSFLIDFLTYLKKIALKINSLSSSKALFRSRMMHRLLKNEILSHSIGVLIPTRDSHGNKFDPQAMILEISELFVRLYGGYSIYPGIGGWLNGNGELIREDILKLESFSTSFGFEPNLKKVIIFILNLKVKYQQEMMAVIIDGCLYLI